MIGIVDASSNNVRAQRWDGSSWSNVPMNPLGTAASLDFHGCAVAYEQVSGRAVTVWNDNSQPNGWKLRFSIWNGSGWTMPSSITAFPGAEPRYMKIAANPASNELTLVVVDSNQNTYGLVWSGASWGNVVSLDTSGSATEDQTAANVVHEGLTNRAMVLYGTRLDRYMRFRIWNGNSWSAEQVITAPSGPDRPRWVVASADPGSNRIMLGVLARGRRVWMSVWDGAAWGHSVTVEKRAQLDTAEAVAVAFEGQSGNAIVAYSEDKAKLVRYRRWQPAAGWSPEGTPSICRPRRTW